MWATEFIYECVTEQSLTDVNELLVDIENAIKQGTTAELLGQLQENLNRYIMQQVEEGGYCKKCAVEGKLVKLETIYKVIYCGGDYNDGLAPINVYQEDYRMCPECGSMFGL